MSSGDILLSLKDLLYLWPSVYFLPFGLPVRAAVVLLPVVVWQFLVCLAFPIVLAAWLHDDFVELIWLLGCCFVFFLSVVLLLSCVHDSYEDRVRLSIFLTLFVPYNLLVLVVVGVVVGNIQQVSCSLLVCDPLLLPFVIILLLKCIRQRNERIYVGPRGEQHFADLLIDICVKLSIYVCICVQISN